MRKVIALLPVWALCLTALVWAAAPTTLNDFFLPGSQPGESGNLEHPSKCDNCHGGYDLAVEPAFNWRGSMMAQAARDPLFYACMAIANQDAPESGDLCIRCHSPAGWLEGRSVPTDGTALNNNDREGVQCDFCHKLVKPSPLGTNSYPDDPDYTAGTYAGDQGYLGNITAIPPTEANGMYVCDVNNAKRGPFVDAAAKHQMYYSPFHKEAALCGTCHDVSNPVYVRNADGSYTPNDFDAAAPDFDPYTMFPVERTYSEWLNSDYNSETGVYAPQFGGNKEYVSTCQDCHMKDVTGYGCNKNGAPLREDLPLHDMTGGNTFIPTIIGALWPGEVDQAALDAGIARATAMLQMAASLDLEVTTTGSDYAADVTVTNETGHKLPSGYPEGRRIWINLQVFDSTGTLIKESGGYDFATAELTHDVEAKIYEIKPGLSTDMAAVLGLTAGPSFHFVVNNQIFSDNRIPPRGFTNAAYESIQSPPVGYSYADGQYWDNTSYTVPANAARVVATLYYQTLSKEYVTFLRDENVTNDWGQVLYDLWDTNGKSAPVVMIADTVDLAPVNEPQTPVAAFVGTPTSGLVPLSVTFTDQSTNEPTSWLWEFGDGQTSTQQHPVHSYTAAGIYSVTLTVSNSAGSDALTMTDYITVTAPQPPTADFTGTPTSGTAPLTVAFTDQSTNAPASWLWDFGDGQTSTLQHPDHTYAAAGIYSVTLTVTNADGSDALTRPDYITVADPVEPTTLHIAAMTIARNGNKMQWADAFVTVHDQDGLPVAAATVVGAFNGPGTASLSATTGPDGVAAFQSDKTKNPPSDWCFTVADIQLIDATYAPSQNRYTTQCETTQGALVPNNGVTAVSEAGNYPNPFNPSTTISFTLAQAASVQVEVLNLLGQVVQTLHEGAMSAGTHHFVWDGCDSHGNTVAAGIYFYRISTPDSFVTRKMLLLK